MLIKSRWHAFYPFVLITFTFQLNSYEVLPSAIPCGQAVVTGVFPSPRYMPSFLSRTHGSALPLFSVLRWSIWIEFCQHAVTPFRPVKVVGRVSCGARTYDIDLSEWKL